MHADDTIMVYEEQLKAGLHECVKVIEKHAVQLCVLVENCNQPDYIKLINGLCASHGVGLFNGSLCQDYWGVDWIVQD